MRGFKQVVRLLPHEVSDMEPLLSLIEAQDPSDFEVRFLKIGFICLLLLSSLNNVAVWCG